MYTYSFANVRCKVPSSGPLRGLERLPVHHLLLRHGGILKGSGGSRDVKRVPLLHHD